MGGVTDVQGCPTMTTITCCLKTVFKASCGKLVLTENILADSEHGHWCVFVCYVFQTSYSCFRQVIRVSDKLFVFQTSFSCFRPMHVEGPGCGWTTEGATGYIPAVHRETWPPPAPPTILPAHRHSHQSARSHWHTHEWHQKHLHAVSRVLKLWSCAGVSLITVVSEWLVINIV